MGDIDSVLGLHSQVDPLQYVYLDPDQSLEFMTSESQSPADTFCGGVYATDLNEMPNLYPSPEAEEESPPQERAQKPKRKRENRYKNAPPSVLSRRRAQNRASQRAYRERKDQRIKDLETMLKEARDRNDVLSEAYAALHAEYTALKLQSCGGSGSQEHLPHHEQHLGYTATGGPALDPSILGMANNDRIDLDLCIYPDPTHSYPL
ncbi:hypothetical protein VTK73DRAFT_6724 [Phialemonium thermophilum]|uniref:Putative transcription factor kapC n=1 Tax=Phialemonium thermophilum TaxID=223376 RepID=A0ABR3XWJ4_9PEZI